MLKKHLQMSWQWRIQSVHMREGIERIRKEMEEGAENGASRMPVYICDQSVPLERIDFFFQMAEELGRKAC